MTMNWVLKAGAGLALVSLLAIAGCHKKAAKPAGSETPSTSGSSSTTGPSAANDRTPADEGDLKGGDNVDGAPAMMSEDAFLGEYRKLAGVTVRPSGLMYRVIAPGPAGGPSPKLTDKVTVAYKGSLMDGTVFDETPVGQNATFGLADTIPGWQEALPLMKVGDAWEIVIPSALAYGEKGASQGGQQVIPPNTPLVFDIKLMSIGGQ